MADADWRELAAVLRRHFEECAPDADFDREAYWIVHTIFERIGAWHHSGSDDVEALGRYLKAINELSRAPVSDYALELMRLAAVRRLIETSNTPDEIQDTIRSDLLVLFLNNKEVFLDDLKSICEKVKDDIESSTTGKEKQVNEEGIKAIDACRIQWARLTRNRPPRTGLSGGFERYVCEIWDHLEIRGDARSALNAWNRRNSRATTDPVDRFTS